MAIQPIDLQTMYSQMNNVARTVSNQQNGAQLSQALNEASLIKHNSEIASQVHKTAENESKSDQIKSDGKGSNTGFQGKNKKNDEPEQEKPKENVIRESYLGQHIDITR